MHEGNPIRRNYEVVKALDSDLPKFVLAGPLSRDTMYSLNVTGPWGSREISNLIRALELQRSWFADDEAKLSERPETTAERPNSTQPNMNETAPTETENG